MYVLKNRKAKFYETDAVLLLKRLNSTTYSAMLFSQKLISQNFILITITGQQNFPFPLPGDTNYFPPGCNIL